MTHTLPELPYAYNALEPVIDEQTMKIHHGKHHQGYVNKLNAALEGHADLQEKSAQELLKDLNALPEAIRTAVRNNGGGHANHSLFWQVLKKDVPFAGDVADKIKETFGSLEAFQEEFSKAALSIFGSGWAWLIVNPDGSLEVVSTANQDNPLSQGKMPILGLDMWEHSWYLLRNADKASYVSDFWSIVNWEQVNKNYERAL